MKKSTVNYVIIEGNHYLNDTLQKRNKTLLRVKKPIFERVNEIYVEISILPDQKVTSIFQSEK